ncbi:MAG: N-acetyltransferase [Flavobacterium sp.]|uniref:GNAT family N-acetyltransferase n=1 Tax=Flavobacterium sp. TaxID=239 RepID=UPI00121ECA04|nr:GNAT family N-acetyltransferase [Flavobacterium sp.]RZJ65476.1 MAG: N-acetyltransferase [Flavobacterium sp.]
MLTLNFSPFPEIETERLFLRRLTDNDVNEVFALRSDPETMKYIPRPLAKNHEEALAHIKIINENIDKNEGINWVITQKGENKMMGIIGFYRAHLESFRAEIGYMILPEYNGKGFITEAIERLAIFGFEEMKLHSIEAIIAPENVASARVLEKNRFVKEAHLRENEFYDGKFLDTVIYSRLVTD